MSGHSILHRVQPAKCKTHWQKLQGDGNVRICPQCSCRVLAAGNEAELNEFVGGAEAEGHTFSRLFRRLDGTYMIDNRSCPPAKQSHWTLVVTVLASVGLLFCLGPWLPLVALLSAVILPCGIYYATGKVLKRKLHSLPAPVGTSLWFGRESMMSCWLPLMFGGIPSVLLFSLLSMIAGAGLHLLKTTSSLKGAQLAVAGGFISITSIIVWGGCMYAISPAGSDIRSLLSPTLEAPPEFWASCKGTNTDGVAVGYVLGKFFFLGIVLPAVLCYSAARNAQAARKLAELRIAQS